jgi:hypothetical protein
MTDEERSATGVQDVILFLALLDLGCDLDDLIALSPTQRLDLLRKAAVEGRIEPQETERLRKAGLPL